MDQIALVTQIVAALGVVVSMCFLAYELHLTRKQSELTNWRELLATLTDYKGQTSDLVFAELIERGHADYDDLLPHEQRAFGLYLEQGIHVLGNFLKHNDALPRKLAGLDDAVSNMFIDALTTPGGAAWYRDTRDLGRFMPATYEVIDAILVAGRKPTAPSLSNL